MGRGNVYEVVTTTYRRQLSIRLGGLGVNGLPIMLPDRNAVQTNLVVYFVCQKGRLAKVLQICSIPSGTKVAHVTHFMQTELGVDQVVRGRVLPSFKSLGARALLAPRFLCVCRYAQVISSFFHAQL